MDTRRIQQASTGLCRGDSGFENPRRRDTLPVQERQAGFHRRGEDPRAIINEVIPGFLRKNYDVVVDREEAIHRALAMAPDKPLFLTEVASCPSGGSRAAWIRGLFRRLDTRYTAVKGLLWFDYRKECDWRISSDGAAAGVYLAAVAKKGRFTADPAALDWFFGGGQGAR